MSEEVRYCLACGSRMVLADVEGRTLPVCPSCGRIHFRDPKVAAAVLVEQEGKVLLVRRVNVPEQGKWSLPAGFVDEDEDPAVAAERECLEETGLRVKVTGLMDVIYGREHRRGASIVIVYFTRIEGGELSPKDDADLAGFFGPEELPPLAFEATKKALRRWRDGR